MKLRNCVSALALIALGLVAAAVLLYGAIRGQRGLVLRALAMALTLAALADPALVREKRDPQKTLVAVVLDRSESQSFGARTQQTDAAGQALDAALKKFGDIETRVVSVANAAGLFPVRSTLVAPILPDPICRKSPRPKARVITMPKGIDPKRYDNAATASSSNGAEVMSGTMVTP